MLHMLHGAREMQDYVKGLVEGSYVCGRRSLNWDLFDMWTQYDTPVNRTYLSTIADNPIPEKWSTELME